MNQKILNDQLIMQTKMDVSKVINEALQNGIPVSVLIMILSECGMELNHLLNDILAKDKKNEKTSTEETPEKETVPAEENENPCLYD